MRKRLLVWFMVVAVVFVFTPVLRADELSDLKSKMESMQKDMALMQRKIEDLSRQAAENKTAARLPAGASSASISDKVAELENKIDVLESKSSALSQDFEKKINFDLYATLNFENFQKNNSKFDAKNVELLANAQMTDRLKIFTEIEFERAAAVEDGSIRGGAVEVEQGWIEYGINQYFNPRFGVLLVPFGSFNLNHFDPFTDLTARPILARKIIPTTWSEAGLGFTGSASLGENLGGWLKNFETSYQLYVINGLTNNFKDTSTRDARGSFGDNADNNNNKALVGRVALNPFSGQEIGFSGYFGKYDSNGHDLSGFNTDWKLTKGPFDLLGEFVLFKPEKGGLQLDSTTLYVPKSLQGIYVQTGYHFWPKFLNNTFLGRGFKNPTLTAVLRYDQVRIADDEDSGEGPNKENRWTIGLNYRPTEKWIFKLDYLNNRSKNEAVEYGKNDGFMASATAAF